MFNELMDTPLDFSAFVMNQLKIDTLTLELLADLTFELMKVSCKSLVELKYFLEEVYKATTDQIDWNDPKTGNIHMEALTIDTQFTRDDVNLYTFKEGNYKRLHLQDIKDMMRLLVQGNITNLTIKERLALNVSWRMFTRSIVIQRHVEHLQLGVESYQNKLNLIRPDTYRSDLKRLPPYSAYPNPRGFIYQNKDKKNKLLRIDELHKFIDDTLNDVRIARDDILKRIRIKYLPQTFWRNVDKEREGAMIQSDTKVFTMMIEILLDPTSNKILVEEEITDEFLNEHLMMLKAKANDDEPWYADYVNYFVGKIMLPRWTPEKRRSKQAAKPSFIMFLILQGFDIEIKDKKKAENLAAYHLSRLENPDLGVFTEEEITDEFLNEHLMMLKAKANDDEPI
nr:reverse transcriptase domain-containing protein [Tanacetum cinerariifolium]